MKKLLNYLSTLSREGQIEYVESRLEALYHEKRSVTQSILDVVAVNVLPGEEEFMTSDQEEQFLKELRFEDIPDHYESTGELVCTAGYDSTRPIEVTIARSSGFRPSGFVTEIQMTGYLNGSESLFMAYLFPQKGAFSLKQQDMLDSILEQKDTQYWNGIANSILIAPKSVSIKGLEDLLDYQVIISIENENPMQVIKGTSLQ